MIRQSPGELVDLQKERLDREEISIHYYKRVKSAANRLDEFYLTGTLHLNMPKHGTKYPISEDNESSSTFSWIIKAIARIPGTMWCG